MLNHTHDTTLRSWVSSANTPGTDFPIQNLPYCVFSTDGESHAARGGVGIGDQILDLAVCVQHQLFTGDAADAAAQAVAPTLNDFMAMPPVYHRALREEVSALLQGDGKTYNGKALPAHVLVPMAQATFYVPTRIGNYTDFYASVHHATNVGSMFRPDNPLLPNYKYVPIGYHGRASSITLLHDVVRPQGQTKAPDAAAPTFGPCKQLDYEMELGFFIGQGNALGTTIPLSAAAEHIFGFCLVNDWSARDIQAWEYQPLGPFLAKNFATTLSPWVVTRDALAPFRTSAYARPTGDPAPLPHLYDAADQQSGGYDITLEVWISSRAMRDAGQEPMLVSRGNFKDMYWTASQMVAHHASNGCDLQPGDLLASGTVSGATPESRGCLLERTWRGTEPLTLPSGESRRFLEDGDEIVMRGYCERDDATRIGFGECRATIVSAHSA